MVFSVAGWCHPVNGPHSWWPHAMSLPTSPPPSPFWPGHSGLFPVAGIQQPLSFLFVLMLPPLSRTLCITLLPDCHLGSGISPPREAWRTGLCGSCFLCECCHPFSLSLCPVDATTASALGSGGTHVLYLGAQPAGVPSWCLICHTGTFWGSAVSLTLAKCEEEWGGSVRMTVTYL